MRTITQYKGRVLCVTEKYRIFYKYGEIFVHDAVEDKLISRKRIGSNLDKMPLTSRLLRREPRCAVMLNETTALISYQGKILSYNIGTNTLSIEHYYSKGMNNPLSFCIRYLPNGEREIFYGEYKWNEEKSPVAIYKRGTEHWEKVFEFPENSITHIHGIVYDSRIKRFYILTGDSDAESGIWASDNDFHSVYPVCCGKQTFRSCVAFPTGDGLIYATDTPLEQNYIYRLRGNADGSFKTEVIYNLPGPCIYGTKIGDMHLFSTTVEPDPTKPKWVYRFTHHLGKGVVDRYSHIVSCDLQNKPREEYKSKKDILPMWLFQFGNILFPYNETETIYVSLQALEKGHDVTLVLE